MRTTVVSLFILFLTATSALALDFTPTLLRITAPQTVHYDFDGANLEIPVTITGTASTTILTVYTRNIGGTISQIRNGFLGWHYVNKIDTCLYVSAPVMLDKGTSVLKWNGKNADGGAVPSGDYTYYLWGYDSVSPKSLVTDIINYSFIERSQIMTLDENGNPLTKPVILKTNREDTASLVPNDHKNYKWTIGNDPYDSTTVETCITEDFAYGAGFTFMPTDHNYFFNHTSNNNGVAFVRKWKWVANGRAEAQTNWGENGEYTYSNNHTPNFYFFAGVVSDGGDYLFVDNGDFSQAIVVDAEIIVLDVETGVEVRKLDVSKFWVYEFSDWSGEWATEGPNDMCFMDGKLLLGTMWAQEIGMIDPYNEEGGDPHVWFNGQGDGYCDMIKADNPFGLPGRAYEQKYRSQMDKNLFTTTPAYDLGALSFSLMGPDGTGISYFAFSGETAKIKFGENYVSTGSSYDGMYMDNASDTTHPNGWWYVAQDSFKGVITTETVDVENDTPAAFAVAQNSPNPFNPSTTITFSIPSAGFVSVDIFNVAGQKIDSVVNEHLSAGSHSVIWDASGTSAGVYFYTVASGKFSKTMKMTLLK